MPCVKYSHFIEFLGFVDMFAHLKVEPITLQDVVFGSCFMWLLLVVTAYQSVSLQTTVTTLQKGEPKYKIQALNLIRNFVRTNELICMCRKLILHDKKYLNK